MDRYPRTINKAELIQQLAIQCSLLKKKTMKLREWLVAVRLNIKDFATLLGVDRSYVHRFMGGKKIPSTSIMDEIKSISMGRVSTYEDLLD